MGLGGPTGDLGFYSEGSAKPEGLWRRGPRAAQEEAVPGPGCAGLRPAACVGGRSSSARIPASADGLDLAKAPGAEVGSGQRGLRGCGQSQVWSTLVSSVSKSESNGRRAVGCEARKIPFTARPTK